MPSSLTARHGRHSLRRGNGIGANFSSAFPIAQNHYTAIKPFFRQTEHATVDTTEPMAHYPSAVSPLGASTKWSRPTISFVIVFLVRMLPYFLRVPMATSNRWEIGRASCRERV
jgi:hypothetical protein